MRSTIVFVATFVFVGCTAIGGRPAPALPTSDARQEGPTFDSKCESFEVVDFGQFEAASLAGHVWVDSGSPEPLPGVQVAARGTKSSQVLFAVSSEAGLFEIGGLQRGEYQVWTCAEGYDGIRFNLVFEPNSAIKRIDVYTGPSEAGGRREVVPLK